MNLDVNNPRERLIVALDYPTADQAMQLVRQLAGEVSFFKIGLQLYTAAGPDIVRAVTARGARVFLDLKLHDIPNTVGKAVEAAGALGVAMLTIHLSGGRRMIEAAAKAAPDGLLLLGVTVLTSADAEMLRETGVASDVEEQAVRLAKLGAAAGVRGFITSPHEVARLRRELGAGVSIITPGVRPDWAAADDQKRFTTPAEALRNGADKLVVGRPVTADTNPLSALRRILTEIN